MVVYQVIVDEKAKSNLKDIYRWLKENETVSIAEKVKNGLVTAIEQLSKMPERHGIAREIENNSIIYRRVLLWSYKIIFVVENDTKTVYVVDVIHARRNPKWLEEKYNE